MYEDKRLEFIGDFSSLKKYKFKEDKSYFRYCEDDDAVRISISKSSRYVTFFTDYYAAGFYDDILIMLYNMVKEGLFNVVELNKYRLRYKTGKGTGKWHYITYYCRTHDEFEEIFNKYLNDKSLCYVEEVKSNGTN